MGDDGDLVRVSLAAGGSETLSDDARVEYFLFQQFLLLFLLTPITGAMALASHAIVGEKQARTLEPLLATPVSTLDLLLAKVLGALVPSLAITVAGLLLYLIGIVAFAEPGVVRALFSARTLILVVLVGPGSALLALQTAIVISSRVNDARTAQQFGVLIIVPLTMLLVAQFTGSIWLTARMLSAIGAGLLIAWVLLLLFSAVLFERESILTRWR
jgi:ABC-2 type transport system permease protein